MGSKWEEFTSVRDFPGYSKGELTQGEIGRLWAGDRPLRPGRAAQLKYAGVMERRELHMERVLDAWRLSLKYPAEDWSAHMCKETTYSWENNLNSFWYSHRAENSIHSHQQTGTPHNSHDIKPHVTGVLNSSGE
jgi:hypothetical protein